jgi:uncharacterized membrane-anchored protein YhcB (DUF1043 family)
VDFTPNSWQDIAAALVVFGVVLTALDWRIGVKVRMHTDTVKRELRDEMKSLTQSIQPNYRNGGHSLADVAELVKQVKELVEGRP